MECCNEDDRKTNCFELEAIVSFDDRGQLVLPKDVRKKFDMEPGEKYALLSCVNEDGLCCFSLIKASALSKEIGKTIRPILAM